MNGPGSGRVRGERRPGKRSLVPERGGGAGLEELSGILLSVGPGSQGAWLGTLLPLHPLLPRHTGDSNSLAEESDSTADS